jgi:hypothetical protein
MMLLRTSVRDVPMRIIFNASSTASLDSVCGEAGDIEDA